MTTQPSEPRTKEGRALLASLASGEYRLTPEQEADYTNAILAIEAEAGQTERDAIKAEAIRLDEGELPALIAFLRGLGYTVTEAASPPEPTTDPRPKPPKPPPYLTNDQLLIAEDIASATGFGHADRCQVWWEDGDGCDCELRVAVADALGMSRIVSLVQERGYDSATGRGEHTITLDFHPMIGEAEPDPAGQHGVAIPPGWGGLQAIVENAHGQGRKVHVGFEETCEQNLSVAVPTPLDVERLHQAFTYATGQQSPRHTWNLVAAEYARLAEGQPVAQEPA